jgi:hypothetical protein
MKRSLLATSTPFPTAGHFVVSRNRSAPSAPALSLAIPSPFEDIHENPAKNEHKPGKIPTPPISSLRKPGRIPHLALKMVTNPAECPPYPIQMTTNPAKYRPSLMPNVLRHLQDARTNAAEYPLPLYAPGGRLHFPGASAGAGWSHVIRPGISRGCSGCGMGLARGAGAGAGAPHASHASRTLPGWDLPARASDWPSTGRAASPISTRDLQAHRAPLSPWSCCQSRSPGAAPWCCPPSLRVLGPRSWDRSQTPSRRDSQAAKSFSISGLQRIVKVILHPTLRLPNYGVGVVSVVVG